MSDFDFESALVEQAQRQAGPSEDTPVEPTSEATEAEWEAPAQDNAEPADAEPDETGGESGESGGRPRDERGRFARQETEVDPEVESYLARFGGDMEAAVKAAAHQTSLIGRQGSELGDLRRQVEELRQAQQQAQQPQQQQWMPSQLEDEIAENPAQIAMWAAENGQSAVYDAAMEEWFDRDPRGAARFERAIEMEMLKSEMQQQLAPVIRPVQEQVQARTIATAHRALREKYPDLDSTLESATEADLTGLDKDVVRHLQQSNPGAAVELVYRWVKAGRQDQAAAQAQASQEAARAAKKEAAVVTSSSAQAREDKDTMALFKEAMLAPDPYSVLHGLRF